MPERGNPPSTPLLGVWSRPTTWAAISVVALMVIEGVRVYRMYRVQRLSLAEITRMGTSAARPSDATGLRRKIASASAGIQPIRGRASGAMDAPRRHIQSDEQAYVTPAGSPVDTYGSLRLQSRITSCYEQALASEPVFTGKLSLSLEVDPTGHVARTALVPEPDFVTRTIPFPSAFLACVDAAAHELTYEVPKAAALVTLSYRLSIVARVIFEHERDWRH